MTKQEIQNLIDANLATGTVITAVKHREVETAILDFIQTATTSNVGFITVGDVDSGNVGDTKIVGGDVVSATITTRTSRGQIFNVVLTNALPSLNYFVRTHVQSLGNMEGDNDIHPIVFKVNTTNSFYIYVEDYGQLQNIRLHIETQAI